MKLYGIRYAKGYYVSKMRNFPFYYFLCEYDGKWILFDTGFSDPDKARVAGTTLFDVEKEIAEFFGEKPSVDAVVITHRHFDHIEDIVKYSDAEVYMTGACCEGVMAHGPGDVKEYLSRAEARGLLHPLGCAGTIFDKFSLELIGGHSEDSGIVHFEEAGRHYCITGDECFSTKLFSRGIPCGGKLNPEKNAEFTKRGSSEGWIALPSHDPDMLKNFKRISENIVEII